MKDALFDRWPDIERVLDDVIDLPGPARRHRAAELCGSDAALFELVEWLLTREGEHSPLPAEPTGVAAGADAFDELPVRIGRYRIERELGRGGMGRVLLGRGEDGPAPLVAIKLLDLVTLSAATRRRFARERETLARLQHPHIARLVDAGVTDDGTPFLVTEYVDGEPIDQYCERRRASLDERLALFRQVCEAVEYAHGQLIVHRDLKPANVFVDRFGHVKLLDFGIAKWLGETGGDVAATQTAHRVLTPAHAAPEQFRGDPVTVATDVYQLGLLLYRLLTGRSAHDRGDGSVEQMRQAVLDTEPDRPSRAVTDAAWRRQLEGDLDAIVLKALRHEPVERYPTVEALRRDLDDFRACRPVAARQGSRAYVVRKYLRRHRTAVAVVLAVVGSSALGVLAVWWQARVAAAERDRARAAEARAAAINAFLVEDLLAAATPERTRGVMPTVDVYLDLAAKSVGQAFEAQPEVAAEIDLALARSYASLGKAGPAGLHAGRAVTRLSGIPGADAPALLRARALVAEFALEEGHYAEARADLERLLLQQERLAGHAHPDTLRTRGLLARATRRLGQVAEAERGIRPAIDLATRLHPGDRRLGIELRAVLVDVLTAQGRTTEAEPVVDEMLRLARGQYGEAHPRTLEVLAQRAAVLTSALKYREAVEANRDVVTACEQVYGPEHPATGRAYGGLAVALSRVHGNGADEVRAPAVRAHEIFRRALGDAHPDTLQALRNLGIWHRYRKDYAEALRIARDVHEARRRALGERHRATFEAARSLATLLAETGQGEEARRFARALRARFEEAAAAADIDPLLLDDYAVFLLEGQPPEVRDALRAAEVATRAVAATNRQNPMRLRTLARAHLALGDTSLALATLEEALRLPDALASWTLEEMFVELMREHRPAADLETWLLARLEAYAERGRPQDVAAARTLRHLARLLAREGRHEEAERRFREAVAHLRRTYDERHFELAEVRVELGEVLAARGALAEAEQEITAGAEAALADYRTGPRGRAALRDRVVRFYESIGAGDRARRWRERPVQ